MNSIEALKDIPLSILGFGCYGFCGAYGAALTEEQMINILNKAYDIGILFYDTADQYGNTEEVLGKAVKGYRDKISIASKVGIMDDNSFNLSRKHVTESCERSLKRLKTDYIDIYQVHFDDPGTPVSETVEALEQLKREGKIRHYGIGHLPLDRSLEYFKIGHVSTVLAEMSAAAVSRYNELYPLQSSYNFEIIAFSVTGRGLLSGKIDHDTEFENGDIRSIDPLFKREKFSSGLRIMKKLREIGNRYNKTSAQTAISWVIQKPGIAAALTGPTNLSHLYENSEVLHWRLDELSMKEIDTFIEKEEDNLKKAVREEIAGILRIPFRCDFYKACDDLIYAMEYCLENKLICDKDIVPEYLEILKMKKDKDKPMEYIETVRKKLNEYFFTHK